MDVEVLGAGDFAGLRDEWAAVARRDRRATPFLSAEWVAAWLESWEPRGEAWIVCVRDGGSLRGIAPLVVTQRAGMRVIGMLGKEPGDYWDVLAAEADRPAVAAAVAEELLRRSGRWDIAGLTCLEPDSPTADAFGAAGLRVVRRRPIPSPCIALPGTFEDYLASLPGKHRSNLRKHLRKLDGGEVELRAVSAPDEIREAMARWRDLRSRQWRAAGREINPTHEEDGFSRFMTAVALSLVPAGAATLWEFRHEGRVAGVYLNFHDDRAFYWYLGGFDPDLARVGLGKIAIGVGIRDSIAAGRTAFDFTRGPEPYKYWYGAADRELQSLLVGHGGVRSRLALAAAAAVLARRDRD